MHVRVSMAASKAFEGSYGDKAKTVDESDLMSKSELNETRDRGELQTHMSLCRGHSWKIAARHGRLKPGLR